jgi:hypothetical protein
MVLAGVVVHLGCVNAADAVCDGRLKTCLRPAPPVGYNNVV